MADAFPPMNWGLSVKVSFVVPVTRPDDARELYRSLVRNIPESEREIVLSPTDQFRARRIPP